MTMHDSKALPLVALIGRPNVGKSTLFNRLIKGRRALTHDRPGVTRDRMYGLVRRDEHLFRVVDTGGVNLDDANAPDQGPQESRGFEREIYDQARAAMDEAQVLALVADGREGCTAIDQRLARFLRQSGKPVLLLVNKVDGPEQEDLLLSEFYGLGLDIVAVSAAHGYNLRLVVERLVELLPPTSEDISEEEPEEPDMEEDFDPEAPELEQAPEIEEQLEGIEQEEPEIPAVLHPRFGLRLAMLGRPNAGKSSLVNALVGEQRMIVSEIAGTTRDSVDVTIERQLPGEDAPRRYTFVDTAGVRRRTRITDSLERFSVHAALQSGKKADVAFFVMDATQGVTQQDKKLIAYLDREKVSFIALVNKMDLLPRKDRPAVERAYAEALRICPHVPLRFVSAKAGSGLKALLPLAEEIWQECGVRVSTGVLNRAMAEATARHQPPVVKRKRARFYYLTQARVRPPTFVFFVNDPERILDSYARYLENQLRKLVGIKHAPMAVHFRARSTRKS